MLQKSPMFAYLPVKDLSRARKFYEQKLGFKPGHELGGGVVTRSEDRKRHCHRWRREERVVQGHRGQYSRDRADPPGLKRGTVTIESRLAC